jgi:integrase
MKGTKDERSPGVWRLRVFIGPDPVTGHPRQVSRTFRGTEREADAALAQFLAEVTGGALTAAAATTLAELLEQWLEHIKPDRSPSTVRGYRFKIERINAKLGQIRLDELTPRHLDRAYRTWLDEGLDPSSVHHLHRVLSAALHQAVRWRLLASSPTGRASPPARPARPPSVPNPQTVQQLVTAAEERGLPVLAALISVAATTGMRRGEIAGLRWGDVDFEKAKLHVRRSIRIDVDRNWVVGPTKAHQARRIALDDYTLSVLRSRREQAERAASDAGGGVVPDRYVFSLDPRGVDPLTPDHLSSAFARLCRAAGLTGVTLQTLRHFSASMLIASGRDVQTIAGRLGHSDASTTRRVYAHLVEDRDQDAADYLGSLLAERRRSIAPSA